MKVYAYAAQSADTPLGPFAIERRAIGPADVAIDILFCGVCHSDLHAARGEWGGTAYPIVPGHEIVGRVREVGAEVTRHSPGDMVGVGCMVDSCRVCEACTEGDEQCCVQGMVATYGAVEKQTGLRTNGGYSKAIIVDQNFVLRIPAKLDPAAAAPLLCAGITTYSPLKHWKVGPGQKVGVVGLGGLGHVGVKLAKAMGASVVLFTTSPSKIKDGIELGADDAVVSTDETAMAKYAGSFHFILNTVAAAHDLNPFLALLRRNGVMTLLGAPATPHAPLNVFNLIGRRRSLAGSLIGGIAETQEMLDFCAEHDVVAEIEKIPMAGINTAYDRMIKNDVRYRFVIDMATLS
jgi:alcohol dehydrogenase (NADP+)